VAPKGSDGVQRAGAPIKSVSAAPTPPPQSASRTAPPSRGSKRRPDLLKLARTLRKNATPYEKRLWSDLRRLKSQGFHFRRQVVLGQFIIDFACHQSKVVIELDGNQHGEPEHAKRDSIRDAWLTSEGFHVLRFWNSDLHENYDNVLDDIYHAARNKLEPVS